MLKVIRSQQHPYAIAFLACAIALGLTWLLEPLMSPTFFALFYPAVMVSSLYGGLQSGLLSILLAGLVTKYFFLPPLHSLTFTSANTLFRFTVLLLVALMITLLSTALRTAKQRMELSLSRLRRSEEQYRLIVETTNEGVWLVDAQAQTTYVNAQMAQLLGYSIQEMLGRSAFDYIYEEDRAEAEGLMERRRQGLSEQVEFRLRCQDGSPIWVNCNVNSLSRDNGEGFAILAMVTDVTERKRTEKRQRIQSAVTRVLSEATILSDAVPTILQSLCESLGWQVGMIWSLDRQANVLRFVESWHTPTINVAEFTQANQQATFAPGIGLPGRIWATRQPTWISHLVEDNNFPRVELAAKAGLQGALGFPIRLENEILGVIECFSDSIQEPDPELLQMMMSIGSQMGQFMERKRSEEALAENQKLFLSFMNNIPGTAFIKDEQGRYLYANPVAEKLVNCQRQELIGKTDFDILPAEVAQQIRENDRAVIAADQPKEIVEALPQEDGIHYLLSLKFPFKDASGKQRVAGMSFDISDRQRAEEKIAALNKDLNRRVNELQTLLDVIPIGIGIALEPDCRDIQINPAFSRWLNVPPQVNASTSQPNAEQLPHRVYRQGRELPPQEQPIQYAAAHGVNVRNVELEIVRDDGTVLHLLANAAPLLDEEGQVRGCVGAFLDISERKQAEESLRASENLYRTLSEAVPNFIWSCDAQGQLDFVNSRWLEYAGVTVEEMNAGGFEQVSHPEDLSGAMQRWNLAIHKGEPFEAECRYRSKDGVYRWFMVRAIPLKDAQENILKWIGVTTDIHERKQTEEALSQSEERLRVALKNSPISVFNQDRELRYIWKYGSDFEDESEDILGKYDIDLLTRADAEILTQIKRQVLETGMGTRQEVKISLHGQDWYYDLTVEPLRDTNNQVIGVTCAAFDISERKQAEMELQKSETVLHAFLASSPIGLAFLDRDLHYIHANEALATINGIPLSGHLGRTLWDVLPGWAAQLAPILQRVMQTQEPLLNQELSGEINLPGVHRHCLVSYYPVCLPDGQVLGVGVTSMDVTELKRAEQSLRESNSLFRRMADGAPVFIWMSGLDGHCTYFNQPWLDFVGQTLEEALTLGWLDGMHPDDKEYCLETYLSAFNARQRFQVEYRHRRQDGEYRWLLDEGVPLFNEDGRFAGYIGSGIDITERRQTEQAQQYLAEASRVLSSSLDYQTTLASIAQLTVPELADWCTVHLIEEDGSVQPLVTAHVNPAKIAWANQINQQYPFDPNDVRGVAQVLRTGQSELYPDIPDSLLVEAARDQEHLQILREVGFKSVMIVPLLTRGRTIGTISFVAAESGRQYDSTDLALAEELARRAALAVENARLYQQAQQARQTAEQAADVTARLQSVTAAFSEALTLAQVAEVVMNQGMAALGASSGFVALLTDNDTSLEIVKSVGLPDNVIDDWKYFSVTAPVPMAELVRTGKPIFLESIAACASQYPILTRVANCTGYEAFACLPLTVEGRMLGGMSFSFALATSFSPEDRAFMLTLGHLCGQAIARARLYEAEQRARTEAEAANRIKDEFLAILSHELRSPLNPILGWTRLLRSRKFDEKATDRALEIIERNAKLQTQLIEDLLDVSRILRGKLVLNVSPVNLVTTIEAALETVRLAAQTKEIQIQTLFEANVGQVSGDANRLQQVVWNLLSNAIKFTPSGGRVEVRLEQVGSQVQIHVRDTGKGISPEFLPYVFEYFRQENSSTTRQFGGLGLGLAIVRYLTELHGGSVHAESAGEGLGSTFTVTLPLMGKAVEVDQEPMPSHDAADLDGLRILVVDDETDIRELVAFILQQSGAAVTVAASAEEALAAWNQSVPDVLLSDIGMPDVDGYMLMRQVRTFSVQQGGQIPAIALTAYAGEYNQQQAFQAGFQLHISKPVEPEELVRAIAHLVRRSSP